MVLESAIFHVDSKLQGDFEIAFEHSQFLLSESHGYVSHELQRSTDTRGRYLLLVEWQSNEDADAWFPRSQRFFDFKAALDPFLLRQPEVDRYCLVAGTGLTQPTVFFQD